MTALVVNCIGNVSLGSVDTELSNMLDVHGKYIDIVYLTSVDRILIDQINDVDYENVRTKLIKRVRAAKIMIIYFCIKEFCYKLFDLGSDGLKEVLCKNSVASAITEARNCDLLSAINCSDGVGFLESDESYHFVTPSHCHTNTFVRLGDLIRKRDILDRMAFWILEHLSQVEFLIVDTYSIAAIPLRASQLLKRYLPFDYLPTHPISNAVECSELVRTVIPKDPTINVLFLVSVVSSGSLVREFKNMLQSGGIKNKVNVATFYSFTKQDYALSLFESNILNFHKSDCTMCAAGSQTIDIHPTSYYVNGSKDSGILLKKDIAERGYLFFDKYKDHMNEIVTFHKGDSSINQKHYAYYIDVLYLSKLQPFKDTVKSIFSKYNDCENIAVVTRSSVSFKGLFGLDKYKIFEVSNVEDFLGYADQIKKLEVLIVFDQVVITGDYFIQINNFIRENVGNQTTLNEILFLSALYRPTGIGELDKLRQIVAYKSNDFSRRLEHVEYLVLPDYDHVKCPWCIEKKALQKILKPKLKPEGFYDERLEQLSCEREGIKGEIAFSVSKKYAKPTFLGAGSFLGPQGMSVAGVLLCVASAVQQLRENSKAQERLSTSFPSRKVFASKNFSNYSEEVIRSALIRVLNVDELGISQKEETMDVLFKSLRNEECHLLASEMIVAVMSKKFPNITRQSAEVGNIFSKYIDDNNVLEFVISS